VKAISNPVTSMRDCAASLILFHPDSSLQGNIESFADKVGKVYVFDNSPRDNNPDVDKLKKDDRFIYLSADRNIGLAKALNRTCAEAFSAGYKYILTMDQDSYFPSLDLNGMISVALGDPKIGIVSALHQVENDKEHMVRGDIEEISTAMTSGNLLDLSIWQKAGGFEEKMFIDYVDHEFCLRLRKNGYKIIRTNKTTINHRVGNLKKRRFLIWTVRPTNHPAFRQFYQTRNWLYLKKYYKKYFPDYFKINRMSQMRRILKILLYENRKFRKLFLIFKGYTAYKRDDFRDILQND
jgi:rhamnosyltransferase